MILNYPVMEQFLDAVSQAMIPISVNSEAQTPLPVSIYLCVGDFPTDQVIAKYSGYNDPAIVAATTGSYTSAAALSFFTVATQSSLTYTYDLSGATPVTATKSGTIGWAVIASKACSGILQSWGVVDVGLPNSGFTLSVDKTTVSIGDTVNILDLTYTLGVQNG